MTFSVLLIQFFTPMSACVMTSGEKKDQPKMWYSPQPTFVSLKRVETRSPTTVVGNNSWSPTYDGHISTYHTWFFKSNLRILLFLEQAIVYIHGIIVLVHQIMLFSSFFSGKRCKNGSVTSSCYYCSILHLFLVLGGGEFPVASTCRSHRGPELSSSFWVANLIPSRKRTTMSVTHRLGPCFPDIRGLSYYINKTTSLRKARPKA